MSRKKSNKYSAKKITLYGITFDSTKEGLRYLVLREQLNDGLIEDLKLQVPFKFVHNNVLICIYKADSTYTDVATGVFIVEDVKGFKTALYKLRKKMMKAFYNIDIYET